MERVAFITTSKDDDLVVSFAIQSPEEPTEVESLTFIRTPRYDAVLEEVERGPRASFDRHDGEEDDLLQIAEYDEAAHIVRIQTTMHRYELDVRKVAAEQLLKMRTVFRSMNDDGRVQLRGL